MKRANGRRSQAGRVMIAGSLNRLRRKGCTASSESGPPRLNRMMEIFKEASLPRLRGRWPRNRGRRGCDAPTPVPSPSVADYRDTSPEDGGGKEAAASSRRRLPVAHDLDQLRDVVWRGL